MSLFTIGEHKHEENRGILLHNKIADTRTRYSTSLVKQRLLKKQMLSGL
jgi:hypothetical protein